MLTLEQRQWEGLVELMGEPEWALDPALRDPLERSRRGAEINRHLRAWAKTQRVDDVVKKGQALSVPLAKYNEPATSSSRSNRRRAAFLRRSMPGIGAVPVFTAPFQLDGKPLESTRAVS